MEYNDINALLNSVLNDDEPDEVVVPEPEATGLSTEDIKAGLALEGLTPEAEIAEEPDPVIRPEEDAVLDIESLIANASGEVEEEPESTPEEDSEPEEVAQCATPEPQPIFAKGAGDDAIQMPEFTSDELMESIDIRNFGTLVTLRTARWHAKVKDRKASKKQAADDGAVEGTYETSKHLLSGADEKLKRVHKAIDAARTAHYALTLPWSVVAVNETGKRSGSRLLPNTLFMEYTTAVANAKVEMDTALSEFVIAYPNLITIAQQKMGTAFNQIEYPAAASIHQHFDLQFEFDPIPKGSDFDGLQGQQVDKLAEALNRKTRTMLENAMQDAWLKLYDTVQHAATKLANPDAMFHYTLIEKLCDQASMLKHLNVTGDSRIEEIRDAVERDLTKHEVKDIRKDDALRKLLAEKANSIHERMKEYANEAE
jgi:hypothetical protein